MASPNFVPGRGGLVTNRYDFQSHIEGTSFRHNANQIDVNPPVFVNGVPFFTVSDALGAVSALTSAANTLIFKPNGIANSNVYTSWTALMTARKLVQGPATIVIDSTASTTIASLSNGASVTAPVIHVGSTVGFLAAGSIQVVSSTQPGAQTVNYTGITPTSFIGCTSSGTGTLSTGGAVYQNNGAIIDVGTWDLTQNTSIIGNVDGLINFNIATLFVMPDGSRLLNPYFFKNLLIECESTNPSGAIDISDGFILNCEINNSIILGGSAPVFNSIGGNVELSGLTVTFSTLFSGTIAGSLSLYLNDQVRLGANTVNLSGGTANIYVNTSAVFCATPQPGANINGLGAQNPSSDVLGQPGNNFVNTLSGDGTNPITINTNLLQWAATPTGGSFVGFSQKQSTSGTGDNFIIEAQNAMAGSNTNGGSVAIVTGAGDGTGTPGSIELATSDFSNSISISFLGINLISTNIQIAITPTSITIGEGPANTSTAFQVGGNNNLVLTSSLFQWDSGITSPAFNQAVTTFGNGTNFSIAAQSSTGVSSTGGNLLLSGGTGTNSNGYVQLSSGKKYYQFSGSGTAAKNVSNYLAAYNSTGSIPQVAFTIPAMSNGQVATVEVTYVGNDTVTIASSSGGKIAGSFYCTAGTVTQIGSTVTVYNASGGSLAAGFTTSSNTIQVLIIPPVADATHWQLDIYVSIA